MLIPVHDPDAAPGFYRDALAAIHDHRPNQPGAQPISTARNPPQHNMIDPGQEGERQTPNDPTRGRSRITCHPPLGLTPRGGTTAPGRDKKDEEGRPGVGSKISQRCHFHFHRLGRLGDTEGPLFSLSRMVANSDECGAAQRCASSAITRSKVGTRPSLKASAICGDDW
jgi:hypothetical protein